MTRKGQFVAESRRGHDHAARELMATLEKVSVPCFIGDVHGTITWVNAAARRAFGDVEGKSIVEIVAPEDVPVAQRQLQRKLRGAQVTDYDVDVCTEDGRRVHAEISSVLIPGGDAAHAVFGLAVPRKTRPRGTAVNLTPRQTKVLHLLGEGASTAQIATSLHISTETVRNHVRHILRRLGAHSRLEAVATAQRRGLLRHE